MTGRLVVAGTPIGNPDDASPRLRDWLGRAGVVAAEDTRRTRRLVAALGVRLAGRLVSYHDANESVRTAELLDDLRDGTDVLLVTDAGMPSVSDPGFRLVSAAAAAGVAVTVLPGPSAVTAALAVSALPADRWCFEGFLPRRRAARAARLAELAAEPRTLVFFEAPHRAPATLADMAEAMGAQRAAVVCRELTKTFEEVRRGTLAEHAAWAAHGVRGELTLVVAGAATAQPAADGDRDWAGEVAAREAAGEQRRAAIAAVAAAAGVPKRTVYAAVVAAKTAGRAP